MSTDGATTRTPLTDAFYAAMPATVDTCADADRFREFGDFARKLEGDRAELLAALEMVRDADNDCARDFLPTIPKAARSAIDAAIAKATS